MGACGCALEAGSSSASPMWFVRASGVARGLAKRSGLVATARRILRGEPGVARALARDPALGRFTAAMERALTQGSDLAPLLALVPRLAIATALEGGGSLSLPPRLRQRRSGQDPGRRSCPAGAAGAPPPGQRRQGAALDARARPAGWPGTLR